jgi:hypothetical protein
LNWVDINNAGTVVFASQLGAEHGGYNGIFNGPTFDDRVIGPGDQIFGSTVRDAFMRRGGLKDNGEVGFYYITTDSKWGVAIATPALVGDADLNRSVDFDDYSRIDNGFNNHLAGWSNGDFDGNGVIDFDDYSLIDQAFNTQTGGSGTRALPEPMVATTLTVLTILASVQRRRRCRR